MVGLKKFKHNHRLCQINRYHGWGTYEPVGKHTNRTVTTVHLQTSLWLKANAV